MASEAQEVINCASHVMFDERKSSPEEDVAVTENPMSRKCSCSDDRACGLEHNCDFVLVWEEKNEAHNSRFRAGPMHLSHQRLRASLRAEIEENAVKRISFEKHLENDADLVRIDERHSNGTIIHYILVTIKDKALAAYAYRRHMRLPLKSSSAKPMKTYERIGKRKSLLKTSSRFSFARDSVADKHGCQPEVNKYFSLPISDLSAVDMTPDKIAQLLTHRQRQEIANYILMTTTYQGSDASRGVELGLGCLLHSKVYKAAFCPHEPLKLEWNHEDSQCPNLRTYLHAHWANPKKLLVYQPLDQVREYFGETITFYFAWLGFYTFWLVPAAIVGLVVFLVGVIHSFSDEFTDQICNSNITLCPLCHVECSAQQLSDQCTNSRISRVFDYPGSVAYSLFMTFWAVFYLEFWKRNTSQLSCAWDVLDYQSAEEPLRPEIINYRSQHGVPTSTRRRLEKLFKMAMSAAAICVLVVFVLASVLAVILYRLWVRLYLIEYLGMVTFGSLFASVSSAALSCIFMFAFAPIYDWIATKLTDLELHEYQSSYERSLALKLFCFSFVNFFSSTLYVAFVMGRFMGIPGRLEKWFGELPPEACTGQDCVFDLTKHIYTFLAIKMIFGNFVEHALPPILESLGKWFLRMRHVKREETIVEDGREVRLTIVAGNANAMIDPRILQLKEDLAKSPYDTALLFDEYLEIVLQFGFVVMFGAACPLIALIALINNAVELRLDANKLVKTKRRPVASRAQNIGVWEEVLTGILFISILTNGCYVAFTTDFLQRQSYKYEYGSNGSMSGYLEFRLVSSTYKQNIMDSNGTLISSNDTLCYFFSNDQNPNFDYYHFLAIRLAFVLIFENFAVILVQIFRYMIPDEPSAVRAYIREEREELDRWHAAHTNSSAASYKNTE